MTEEAIEFARVVDENVDRLLAVKDAKEEIQVPCGEQCTAPYECWYRDYCRGLAQSDG